MKTRTEYQTYLNQLFALLTKLQQEHIIYFISEGEICNVDESKILKAIDSNVVGTFLRKNNKEAFLKGFEKFNNTVVSNIKYGRLYNWYATNNALFAPVGWHVPTLAEVNTLITNAGGGSVAGGRLKETGVVYWLNPNTEATNQYSFFARGAGDRNNEGFSGLLYGFHMAINEVIDMPHYLYIGANSFTASLGEQPKTNGHSVRLIKDDSILVNSLTDIDGNVYRTTKIGDQVWLADNWACSKLTNGTSIPNVTSDATWNSLTTMGMCAQNNNSTNVFL